MTPSRHISVGPPAYSGFVVMNLNFNPDNLEWREHWEKKREEDQFD